MTPRELAFVDEYPKDWCGKDAAIRAKFSPNGADRTASRLLRRKDIQTAIEGKRKELARRAGLSQDRILAEFIWLGLSTIDGIISWDDAGKVTITASDQLTKGQKAAIKKVKSITTRRYLANDEIMETHTLDLEMHPKEGPLTKLGEKYGLFPKGDKLGDLHLHQHNYQQSTDPVDLSQLSAKEREQLQQLLDRLGPVVEAKG